MNLCLHAEKGEKVLEHYWKTTLCDVTQGTDTWPLPFPNQGSVWLLSDKQLTRHNNNLSLSKFFCCFSPSKSVSHCWDPALRATDSRWTQFVCFFGSQDNATLLDAAPPPKRGHMFVASHEWAQQWSCEWQRGGGGLWTGVFLSPVDYILAFLLVKDFRFRKRVYGGGGVNTTEVSSSIAGEPLTVPCRPPATFANITSVIWRSKLLIKPDD